ncbi:MAG: HmuY family protein, partial [Polyangiaceae bacterium]
MNRIVRIALGITACVGVGACSSVSESETGSDRGGAGAGNPPSMGHASAPDALPSGASGVLDGDASSAGAPDTGPTSVYASTTELDVPVPDTGRVYVKLEGPAIVDPKTPADSSDWDLAFEGFNVYTNSGPSGTAQGSAFGPLDIVTLEDEATPTVPFLSPDKTGGAFADWYAYDGTSHALYSRFHVYGVKSGGALWKAQVLSYYAAQDNAPVSALYQFRYAQLGDPVGTTRTIQVDGTADGLGGAADSPSGCLDLATGTISKLT